MAHVIAWGALAFVVLVGLLTAVWWLDFRRSMMGAFQGTSMSGLNLLHLGMRVGA